MKLEKQGDKYILTGTVMCVSCEGTGLYRGIAEGNNSAVICHTCKGTGKVETKLSFTEFTGRKTRKDVKRVYLTACGCGIADKDFVTKEGKTIRFSEAGCSYEDWLKGAEPKPITDLHCPYMHTNQAMQNKDHKCHSLYNTKCSKNMGFGFIAACKCFENKEECWKEYLELMEK